MKTNIHFWSYLAHFCLEWEIFQTKFVEEIKTHFVFNNVFRKSCRLWDKLSRTRHRWQYNMAHALWMFDTKDYNHITDYVIIIPFPLQQWLYEHLSMFTFICTLCLLLKSEKSNKHFTSVLRCIYLMILKWRQTVFYVRYEV